MNQTREMEEKKLNRATAQAANVSFELHTLGWEAFQNLCGHVTREILGQTATVFSPTNDAGQDGAYQGEWNKSKNETFEGRFVIQCKFTARRDEHLSLGDLKDELAKAEKLSRSNLAQTYLLMTNAKISGDADKTIREAFQNIKGLNHFDIFGSEWLTQQILESKRLRAFVPRIYGLGDLTQILDERVYRQADEILHTWKDNLAKFVPTDAHNKSVKALLGEGFVLLLGDPMAGKSTIAASLALAAADQWQCVPVFVTKPDDFKSHWNPDEPKQFFWVDDVFGQTQFDSSLVEGWNRLFPLLNAALRKGTKILFTSRTYIFNAAQRELKESAFPQIKNSQVTIHVENLTLDEKERILYNHLRLGSQPPEFRRSIKQFLPAIASNEKFFPEVAKRLGDPFFTKNLILHEDYLKRFVEEPKEFLCEIINQLNRKCFAALSLLFMRAGRIAIPPRIDIDEKEPMALLGADLAELVEALTSLEGSLVSQAFESGEQFWTFRHPSIRDAMAMLIAARHELVDIYLAEVKVSELLREVVCGDVYVQGAKVNIPNNRFAAVYSRIRGIDFDDWHWSYYFISFLAKRCSSDFLVGWAKACPDDYEKVVTTYRISNHHFCLILSRLHRSKALSEQHRQAYLERAIAEVLESGESTFLSYHVKDLMTPEEYESVLYRIINEFIPGIGDRIEDLTSNYSDRDERPSDYFSDMRSNIKNLLDVIEDEEGISSLEHADRLIARKMFKLKNENEDREEEKKRKAQEEREAKEMENEALAAVVEEHENEQTNRRSHSVKPEMPSQEQMHKPNPARNIFDDVDQ
jgi:hypothetical protein